MAKVRPEFYVDLKGRSYPTYPGVLIAAHEEGLLGIEVIVLQYPAEANAWTAVCQATVTMRGNGDREMLFQEIGDCNPKNASPQIALASLRMAATRAKGRALRDAIALGATLFEELPAWEEEKAAAPVQRERPARPDGPVRHEVPEPARGAARPAFSPTPEQLDRAVAQATSGWEGPTGHCSHPGCGVQISANNEKMSLHRFRRPLCLVHIQEAGKQAAA